MVNLTCPSLHRLLTTLSNPISVGRRRMPQSVCFIQARNRFDVSGSSTMDSFHNHTPSFDGLYEWLKIMICLPIAVVQLLIFCLSLSVGYLATLAALHGWKDRQNLMPKWHCRLMWVTHVCARVILFTLGWRGMKIRRKKKRGNSEKKKIFIVGATESTGKRIVEQLLAKGFAFKAGVRDVDKAKLTFPSNNPDLQINVLSFQ